MNTVENGLELTYHMEVGGAVIDRVRTGAVRAVVPEELGGSPVIALGLRAFAPHREEGTPDHRRIRSIALPDTLERVGDYAFYGCAGLEQLTLSDRTRRWGSGCLMNCRSLHRIDLTVTDETSPTLCYFADELAGELDVTLRYPDGQQARLLFPEYIESYENNDPAHHFEFHIYGPGFPYHHAFRKRQLDYGMFDDCWEDMLGREYDPDCAMRLAFYRLRWPRGLSDRAAATYGAYLESACGAVLCWLLREGDTRGLSWYLEGFPPGREALIDALALSRTLGRPEATAVLLEQQHRRFPAGRAKTFDL